MSSPSYPITSSAPATIFRRQQQQAAYNLYNTGSADVYLDNSPQAPGLTTPAGFPLHPGAQITWEAGIECYAICAAGQSSTIVTSPAAGGYFDPYSLATNLLTLAPAGQTLAQQIAQNIYITGVPPVDKPDVLANFVTYPFIGNYYIPWSVTGQLYNVSAFQSLNMQFSWVNAYNGATAGGITLIWYADAAANQAIAIDNASVAMATGGSLQWNTPVKSPYLAINPNWPAVNNNLTVYVEGSYRTLARVTQIFTPGAITGGFTTNDYSVSPYFLAFDGLGGAGHGPAIPANTNLVIYPRFSPGVANLWIIPTQPIVLNMVDMVTSVPIYQNAAILAGQRFDIGGIVITPSQFYYQIQNQNGAGVTCNFVASVGIQSY